MHSEYYFEQAIEQSLTTDGGYVKGNPKDYDPRLALFPKMLLPLFRQHNQKLGKKSITHVKIKQKLVLSMIWHMP